MITSDFDKEAINFYKYYYDDKFVQSDKSSTYNHKKIEIDVHGDVCFNILIKKDNNRYTLLGSTIKDFVDEETLINLNKKLKELLFSPMNISIMPITGGLNNIKFYFGCDRFDSFAWLLDLYYHRYKTLILNAGTINSHIGPRLELANFLDSYKNVQDYFNDIYGIDDDFVKKLIDSGKKEKHTKEDFYDYLSLATSFWEKRLSQQKISDYLNKSKNHYKSLINEINEIIKKNGTP